jgi:hypothetical protein
MKGSLFHAEAGSRRFSNDFQKSPAGFLIFASLIYSLLKKKNLIKSILFWSGKCCPAVLERILEIA